MRKVVIAPYNVAALPEGGGHFGFRIDDMRPVPREDEAPPARSLTPR